jgi:hypothetical protein
MMAGDEFATPLGVQRLEQALRLEPLLNYMENVINPANDRYVPCYPQRNFFVGRVLTKCTINCIPLI